MTVEINYSDDVDDPFVSPQNRRYAQLARILRSNTVIDVDCWSRVPGVPLPPWWIEKAVRDKLDRIKKENG